MKRYLGIKEVGAEEMQLDKFQLKYPGRVVNPISGDKVNGYCVTYEDGYQGWSPRDVFKKAYKEVDEHIQVDKHYLKPHEDRVLSEALELREKMRKLRVFLDDYNSTYEDLSGVNKEYADMEINDLSQQLLAMQYYLTILIRRINRF